MRHVGLFLFSVPLLGAVAACGGDSGPQKTDTRAQLMDPTTCKQCHAEHYTEWSGSMHAYASIDPVFRAMNARGQKDTGGQLGNFCVNCHAPLAVSENATTDGLNLDTVPADLQGVTCYFCHQVKDVQGTHNNPLVLANDTTMRGGIANPVKNDVHIGAYSKLHDSNDVADSSTLCGSCHDIVVPAHFSGAAQDVALERTFTEWNASIFSKPRPASPTPESCGNCHMATDINVPIASAPGLVVPSRPFRHHHEFPGIDVAITPGFPEKDVQLEQVESQFSTAMLTDLCVAPDSGNAIVGIDNFGAGHKVPSGASQDRRMWVEVHAYAADGTETYRSGVVPPGTPVIDVKNDPDLWVFRDVALDQSGQPAHMFWQVASIDQSAGQQTPIPETQTLDSTSPLFAAPHAYRTYHMRQYQIGSHYQTPAKVTLTIHMRTIGRDVLNDLFGTGLTAPPGGGDAGVQDASAQLDLGGPADASSQAIVDALPTIDDVPDPGDGGITTTLVWTPALAQAENLGTKLVGSEPATCVITGSSKVF